MPIPTHLSAITASFDDANQTTIEIECKDCGKITLPPLDQAHLVTLVRVGRCLLEKMGVPYDQDVIEEVGASSSTMEKDALRAKALERLVERSDAEWDEDHLPPELYGQVNHMLGQVADVVMRADQLLEVMLAAEIPGDEDTARALLVLFVKLAPRLGPPHLVAILIMKLLGMPFGLQRVEGSQEAAWQDMLKQFDPKTTH